MGKKIATDNSMPVGQSQRADEIVGYVAEAGIPEAERQ